MVIETSIHTVFVLIGPTECGKSTFANEVLVPQLRIADPDKNFTMNVQVISSDDIRRELLGFDYDKHDRIMMEASAQAFDVLEQRLTAVTSFPINAEFVIVDTKGLSEDFRKSVCDIAKANQYNVEAIIFDYKDIKEFYADGTKSRTLIASDVHRLRREVVTNLGKSGFDRIHRIKAKDFLDADGIATTQYKVTIDNLGPYLDTILPAGPEYVIIGDVHEEIDALKTLLRQKGFALDGDEVKRTDKSKNMVPILLGDVIDKGENTEETIRFLHKNRFLFKMVLGNHENFVYKYLLGEIRADSVPEGLIPSQFTSIAVLEDDEELRALFFDLVSSMVPFHRLVGVSQPSFYVTHAPCLNRYVGKLDSVSRRKQRGFVLNREDDIEEQLSFLQDEAVGNHPYHIFGHVASSKEIRIKNKIGIDTGAVYGNRLLSVAMAMGFAKPFFKSVAAKPVAGSAVSAASNENQEKLPTLFERKGHDVSLEDLSDDQKRRLNYILRNKINFISGTISPADKNKETGELESLAMGLSYFRTKGIRKVCMQPKYMGSRCTIYLCKSADESYAVSRNGYKIISVDLRPVYESLIHKHRPMMDSKNIKMILLDGELMPWMALGQGLIDRQFRVIDAALEQEIDFLREHGFEEQISRLTSEYLESDFSKDQSNLSKKQLAAKYGDATYGKLKHVREATTNLVPLSLHEDAHRRYHEQIEEFAADAQLHFKAFDLLKIVFEDGTEEIPAGSTSEVFNTISDDAALVIDFEDPGYLAKASTFYHDLTTDKKMEGVVIKPEFKKPGVASAMKVRNPEYLRIIYGYDYTFSHKYRKLFEQKNIGPKLSTSIKEYALGKRMLSVAMDAVDETNQEYTQMVANMLFETSKETAIDPRL